MGEQPSAGAAAGSRMVGRRRGDHGIAGAARQLLTDVADHLDVNRRPSLTPDRRPMLALTHFRCSRRYAGARKRARMLRDKQGERRASIWMRMTPD